MGIADTGALPGGIRLGTACLAREATIGVQATATQDPLPCENFFYTAHALDLRVDRSLPQPSCAARGAFVASGSDAA